MSFSLFLRCALVLLPVVLTACSDFDWFDEKKTPLAGDRKQVFPGGVPGVNYSSPPLQPSNSNIPIDTQISKTGQGEPQAQADEPEKNQQGKTKSRTARTARNAPPAQPQQPRNPAQAQPADDPWSDSRSAN